MPQLKKSKKIEILLISLIVFFGGFIRIVNLDKVPNGLYSDEAALGYNAYSILQTGRDEFGKSWPIYFRSFGDYKLPLYSYLSTIPVFFWGLSIFSTRIISALSGTFTIILIYLIFGKIQLFKNKYIPLLAGFLFAFSPWSIFFSRGAFETNLGFFALSLAVYFYLLSWKRPGFFVWGTFFLTLSTYAYHTQRLAAYLILPFLILNLIKSFGFPKMRKIIGISLLIFFVTQLAHLVVLFEPAFRVRAAGLFYFAAISDQASKLSGIFPYPLAVIVAFLREFLSQFFAYFSPRNLFFLPDYEVERSIPELSVFFPWLFLPYLIGLWVIWLRKREKQIQFVLFMTVVFAGIPALTKDPFATTRALPLILPLTIVICLGFEKIYSSKYRPVLLLTPVLVLFSIVQFWRSYFVLFPNERAQIWQYGYEQLAQEVKKRPNTLFVIDQSRMKPSYIELAFFLKLPPGKLQFAVDPEIKSDYYGTVEFNSGYKFENIEIRNIYWEKDIYRDEVLVGDELAISENQAKEHFLTKVFDIKDPIEGIVFQGYKTNPMLKCKKDLIACDKLKNN